MFFKPDKTHKPQFGGLEILKYIGPGLLVTVGFIDPGNWAANVAAGAQYGYTLLWMVTLSTIMLILLQHNVAHLGIVTGLCLSEAAVKHLPWWAGKSITLSALLAAISTALAELLGAAIGLHMVFPVLPIPLCTTMATGLILWLLFSNSYRKLERIIIGFVSLIGLAFIFELCLVSIHWPAAVNGWTIPAWPLGSIPIIMSVLGAVVMPHNLFLHSEIIQSRQWNLQDDSVIKRQLRYEFMDTLISMLVGWGINSAMIIVAAATFHVDKIQVHDLQQAKSMLTPLLGSGAALVFALALVFAGIASAITAGMAGGSIFAGLYQEPFDIKDSHSRRGIWLTLGMGGGIAILLNLLTSNLFMGLIVSQIILSIQLPWTIFMQISLTSSPRVMGKYANSGAEKALLWVTALVICALNGLLLWSLIRGTPAT